MVNMGQNRTAELKALSQYSSKSYTSINHNFNGSMCDKTEVLDCYEAPCLCAENTAVKRGFIQLYPPRGSLQRALGMPLPSWVCFSTRIQSPHSGACCLPYGPLTYCGNLNTQAELVE